MYRSIDRYPLYPLYPLYPYTGSAGRQHTRGPTPSMESTVEEEEQFCTDTFLRWAIAQDDGVQCRDKVNRAHIGG